jgi:hypothetical protein
MTTWARERIASAFVANGAIFYFRTHPTNYTFEKIVKKKRKKKKVSAETRFPLRPPQCRRRSSPSTKVALLQTYPQKHHQSDRMP